MRRVEAVPAEGADQRAVPASARQKRPRRLVALALLLAPACSGTGKSAFAIAVQVESDPGKPLSGVRIAVGGAELGRSDQRGRARIVLSGKPGDVLDLTVTCPADYTAPEKPLSVVLRPLAEAGRIPEYRAVCAPRMRSLVLAVRAERGPNLPVKYLGREIARTDSAGAAHALIEVEPNQPVSVTLDTSAPEHAALRPQNPELKLVMPARDEVALFDQTFTRVEPPKPKHRPQPPSGPTRLTTAR